MVEIPKELGFHVETPEVLDRTIENSLQLMEKHTRRMKEDYETYCRIGDERLRDTLTESMNSRLNKIAQSFKDIVSFIQIQNGDYGYDESLSSKVLYAQSNFDSDDDVDGILNLIKKRNDITHDYFNENQLNYELLKAMETYGEGLSKLVIILKEKCQLLDKTLKQKLPKKKK